MFYHLDILERRKRDILMFWKWKSWQSGLHHQIWGWLFIRPDIAQRHTASPHKSLCSQKEKSASAVKRLVKNEKFSLKFASSAFLIRLWPPSRQLPLRKVKVSGFILNSNWSIWTKSRADNTRRGESDLWSEARPAIDGLVCLSLLLGETTVSNNFAKRRQNGFKIGARDKYATLK